MNIDIFFDVFASSKILGNYYYFFIEAIQQIQFPEIEKDIFSLKKCCEMEKN